MAEEKVVAQEAASQEQRPHGSRPQRGPRKPGARKPGQRGPRREEKQYEERVVAINRVSRTVKGGRKMRFAALVVIGDGKGNVGFGTGKAIEVPEAIKKALVKNGTLSHDIEGNFGACKIYLKPAPEGTGVIAGGPVRAVLELAGVKNIYSKVYGSRTPINCIRATINGLKNIKTHAQVQLLRK